MCKTKPIRNQRKTLCRLRLNRPCPSLRVENEAKRREPTLHAPRCTHHASRPLWPVNLEGGASGEWHRMAVGKANPKQWSVASGSGEGSEPTQGVCPGPQKVQNEAATPCPRNRHSGTRGNGQPRSFWKHPRKNHNSRVGQEETALCGFPRAGPAPVQSASGHPWRRYHLVDPAWGRR